MSAAPPCPKCGGTIKAELSDFVVTDPKTGEKSTFLWVTHACPDNAEPTDADG